MTSPPNLRRFTVTESREVMEVRADNLDEVAAWCGGKVLTQDGKPACVVWDRMTRIAEPGELVVDDGREKRGVTREEFERDSEQWTEETWAKKTRSSWSAGPRRR